MEEQGLVKDKEGIFKAGDFHRRTVGRLGAAHLDIFGDIAQQDQGALESSDCTAAISTGERRDTWIVQAGDFFDGIEQVTHGDILG